jgi:hypothetical protein
MVKIREQAEKKERSWMDDPEGFPGSEYSSYYDGPTGGSE